MGILEHKINGTKAEQDIAKALIKPWYKKFESWLIIMNIIAVVVNIYITLN
jgi:hypothetical protein